MKVRCSNGIIAHFRCSTAAKPLVRRPNGIKAHIRFQRKNSAFRVGLEKEAGRRGGAYMSDEKNKRDTPYSQREELGIGEGTCDQNRYETTGVVVCYTHVITHALNTHSAFRMLLMIFAKISC